MAPPSPAPEAWPAVPPPAAQPPSRRRRWIGAVVALAVTAGLGWLTWSLTNRPAAPAAGSGAPGPGGGAPGPGGGGGPGGPGGAGGPRLPPTTVGVAVARRMDLPVTLEALGTVVPVQTVRVRPQVSGVLQTVHFQEGQMVRKGELLAQIDPRPFELALQQATGQRQRDEAQLEVARTTLQRYQTLLEQDSIARQEVDQQAALVRQLEAAVVVDRANEGTARLNLGYTRIVAPVAGRVGLRTVDAGNVVGTGDANGVAVITQLTPIDVEFAIPQDQLGGLASSVASGAPLATRALDRGRVQVLDTGSFSAYDNQVDPQTGTVRAKARFPNAKGQLFPSQFVNVQLQLRNIEGATVVPVAAVRSGPGGDYVFVVGDNRIASTRPVRRGHALPDWVQIVSGLQPGERVVTEGGDRLRDGARVLLPGDAPGQGRRRDGASAAASGGAPGWTRRGPPEGGPGVTPDAGAGSPARAASAGLPGAAPSAAALAPGAPSTQAAPRGPRPEGAAPPPPADARPSPAGGANGASQGPTPEQRKRMLEAVADDPQQLERRKRFLEALDRGDPAAIERWQMLQQRRREAGGAPQ